MADYAPWPVSCATPRDIGQSGLPEPAEDPAHPFGLECAIRCADGALTELAADGTLTKISQKWFGTDITKPAAPAAAK